MRKLLAVVFALTVAGLTGASREASRTAQVPPANDARVPADPLYDRDPDHIWNRVDRTLRVRIASDGTEYGADALDPLLWRETRHMLTPPSHAATLGVLDDFLNSHGERLITDPVRRVVFQRDLWAVFDWAVSRHDDHGGPRRAVAVRVARMIRRLALMPDEVQRLPDSYAAAVSSARYAVAHDPSDQETPFLPPHLLDPNGPWIAIHGDVPLPQHRDEMSRSGFGVYLAVPGGRRATLDYLQKLWNTPEPFVVDPFGSIDGELRVTINSAVASIPAGTQIALVRTMLAVDATGVIRRTPLVESVQLRVFREPRLPLNVHGGHNDQVFYEFVLDRSGLFTSASRGLRAVEPREEAFLTFSSHGIDQFEDPSWPVRRGRRLQMCVNCHHERGMASVRSAARLFKPHRFIENGGSTFDAMPEFWKLQRTDWGYLQALWHAEPW